MKRRPEGTGAIYETGDKRKEFKYRGELMEYDTRDDTSHIFKKYEKLKLKLIDEICDFDKYMMIKKL